MRLAVVLGLLLVIGCAARASDVYRNEVDRGSDLETELDYKVSLQEERDEKPSESLNNATPIEGAASKYVVKFHATVAGKLKDVFELNLTVNNGNAILAQTPLAIRSRSTNESEIDVQFLIRRDWINQAVLAIRCAPWMSIHPETVYSIRLGDYVPDYAPTEEQRIADLRERHSSVGILAWHRNKDPADSANSLSALTVAQKIFAEVNFVGLSRASLMTLLGPPDPEPSAPPNSVRYTFGYRGHCVARRFHFGSKGNVESVEKLPIE
jgi:hypothetical protein